MKFFVVMEMAQGKFGSILVAVLIQEFSFVYSFIVSLPPVIERSDVFICFVCRISVSPISRVRMIPSYLPNTQYC